MMQKTLYNICRFVSKNSILNQKRYSALFVSAAKASEQFVYVIPDVDIKETLLNKELTQQQLSKRKSNVDLNKIANLWSVYEELKNKKHDYEIQKNEIAKELGKLIKNDPENELVTKLKIQSDLLKDNIKKLKVPLWSAEEAAYIEALKLPNNLHPKTPEKDSIILYTHLSPPKKEKNHLTIGQELNILDYKNNENYYLLGKAAMFELAAKFHFSSILKKNKFIQLSNPDFVKSLIVEGCGTNHTDPDSSYILHHNDETKVNKDSRLHLAGGGSLYSFLAYHTKNVVHSKTLPLKYFAMGRQYVPTKTNDLGLFEVSQSSVIEVFGAHKTAADADELLDETVQLLHGIYISLGYHFRIVTVPADKLHAWEAMRVAIEMYSTSRKSYIEIGNLSLSHDYIPKRLLFTYIENKESKYPFLLSGTVLNVPKLLACILEQEPAFDIPAPLKMENITILRGSHKSQ